MEARGPRAASRAVRLATALVMAVALGTPGPGHTQIVRDGTVGPGVAVQPTGPHYIIPDTFGARAGANLFHSFQTFTLQTGQSATFTGPGEIANVISRVTGGERSTIDGRLRSQVGRADFWFLNPAGVVFGPNAQIDLPAAFHVSTADEVRFADGARFSASEPAASRLTVAPPEAFGFLRPNPAGIAVQSSQLETKAGQTLSVVGGDLQVTGGRLQSEGGQANLTAMAGPGTVQAATGASSVPARGAVRLANGARVDTSGDGGGRIALRGGQIEVTGSRVLADNTGTRDATGGITVDSDSLSLSRGDIGASTRASGKAGRVAVTARSHLAVRNGARIHSDTEAQGQAGTVTIHANRLLISGDGANADTYISSDTDSTGAAGSVAIQADQLLVSGDGSSHFTGISSDANSDSTGQAGTVAVSGHDIEVRNGGEISSSTSAQGQAGTVTIHADRLLISGDGARNADGTVAVTGISSDTNQSARGDGGQVIIAAHNLEVHNGGGISSDTSGQGHAGTVTVHADRLLISGDGARNPESTSTPGTQAFTGIGSDAESGSTGHTGNVTVTGRDLTVQNGGEISSSTYARGNAGTVTIQADRLLISGDGARNADGTLAFTGIFSDAASGSTGQAGGVTVTAARSLEVRNGGAITSETWAQGNAGTVTVHADRVLISGDGARNADGTLATFIIGISSQAYSGSTGQAGNVTVTGRDIEVRNGGQISSATSPGSAGAGGTVDVHGGDIRLADSGTITTQSGSPRHGGAITLTADGSLSLTGGAQIASSATQADAGQITITTPGSLRLSDSSITTEAQQGGGGQITLTVGRLIDLVGSRIASSTFGPNATEDAGNLTIDPQFLVLDHSSLLARANRGRGGNIRITAGQILRSRSPDSRIDASSAQGINGQVDLHAPDQDVGRTLAPLPSGFLDASALLPTACATRRGAPASRFKPNLVASWPSDPNGPLVGSYLSYLGHRPPDRGAPSRGAAAAGTQEAAPEPVPAGAGRLSFACGI